MKTFFSIVYIPLKPDLQEKISIGLFMFNDKQNHFKISEQKLQILKGLLSIHRYKMLKSYFFSLKEEIQPSKYSETGLDLIDDDKTKWINSSYISYLSRYSNNLVHFSEPKTIDLKVSEENFKLLFEKFVFSYLDEIPQYKEEDILKKVKSRLYSKIEERVNLNVVLNPKHFSELVTPVDVNFLGKNGETVSGQTIDFGKRLYNLEHDLTSYISFTKAVDFQERKKGKYFVVGEEPNKKEFPKNHKTWSHVRDSHLVEYVDLEETERIQNYILEKGVTPYFEKEA